MAMLASRRRAGVLPGAVLPDAVAPGHGCHGGWLAGCDRCDVLKLEGTFDQPALDQRTQTTATLADIVIIMSCGTSGAFGVMLINAQAGGAAARGVNSPSHRAVPVSSIVYRCDSPHL